MLKYSLALIGLSVSLVCSAAEGKPDRLFASNDMLEITLSAPLRTIARDKDTEPEDRPGTLSYTHDGKSKSFAIGIRARGKSQRCIVLRA